MTTDEYAQYETAVASFFESEGIENLSSGHITCPQCGADWTDHDHCPNGHGHRDLWDEPSFSWRPCDCCNRPLGGERYHATGYQRGLDEIYEYEVCGDCIYYAEYGRLDDLTMLDVEQR